MRVVAISCLNQPLPSFPWPVSLGYLVSIFFRECHQSLLRRRLKLVCLHYKLCEAALSRHSSLSAILLLSRSGKNNIHQQYCDFYLTHKWKQEYLIHRFLNSLVKELWEQWSWWSPKHHNILNLIEFSN